MAKKASRPAPVQNISPGANPYSKSVSHDRKLGKLLGSVCLLMFILFEQLWIGTLSCALTFAVIFVIQVFYEKSRRWFASPYLYATIITAVLAYAEYQYSLISNLLKL